MISPEVLSLLACPVCHAPLAQSGSYLVCTKEGTGYPIEDGIPRLLPESAVDAETMRSQAQ